MTRVPPIMFPAVALLGLIVAVVGIAMDWAEITPIAFFVFILLAILATINYSLAATPDYTPPVMETTAGAVVPEVEEPVPAPETETSGGAVVATAETDVDVDVESGADIESEDRTLVMVTSNDDDRGVDEVVGDGTSATPVDASLPEAAEVAETPRADDEQTERPA